MSNTKAEEDPFFALKTVTRVVIVALAMGAWLYLFHDKADAMTPPASGQGCSIPAAMANAAPSAHQIDAYCKHATSHPGLDPTEKFMLQCGGAAVIATWFTRSGKIGNALSALTACSWGALFESHPKAYHAVKAHAYYRSYGSPGGPRAV